MAHDTTPERLTEPHIEPVQHDIGLTPVTLGFSLLAGGGVTAMVVALAVGVIQGETAGSLTGLLFIGGLLAFITGVAAWIGTTRPFTHFDNINLPMDTHGHAAHPEEHADEHAIVTADEHHPAPAHH